MTTTTKPAGLLMTGAIGAFILAAGLLVGQFVGQGGILSGLLIVVGHILVALGFGAWAKVHGGMSIVASIFGWLAAGSAILALVLGMSGMFQIAAILAIVMGFAVPLTALFGGLTLMASGNAVNAQMAKIGGILLIVSGAIMLAMVTMLFMQVVLPAFLSYIILAAGVAGWVLGGIAFLSEKG